jgi:hypothetical protein
LLTEVENRVGGGDWGWTAVVMGPVGKLESGRQVWATVTTVSGGGVKAKGTVILAKDGDMPASEIEVEARI